MEFTSSFRSFSDEIIPSRFIGCCDGLCRGDVSRVYSATRGVISIQRRAVIGIVTNTAMGIGERRQG